MALQEKLDKLKAGFEAKAPKDALEIMHRATDDLRNSGILQGVLKSGDTAPDFELKNAADSWTLPMPARFIIDRDSIVRYAEVDPDYTVRPEPGHTMDALKTL